MGLTQEDRQRIEQEARLHYSANNNYPMEQAAFKKGAEYATIYERQRFEKDADYQELLKEKDDTAQLHVTMENALVEKIRQFEAERAELKAENERLFKAFHDSEIKVDLLQAEIKTVKLP